MYAIAKGDPGQAGLARQGPQLPVVLSGPSGHGIYTAQIDDGSSISSVDLALLRQLGCQQSGTANVGTVMGSGQEPIYTCGMAALDGVNLAQGLPGVLGDSLPAGGPRVLIGRDILQRFDFQYGGAAGTWQLDAPGPAPAQGSSPWRSWWVWATAGAVGTVLGVGILAAGRGVEHAVLARHAGRVAVERRGGPASAYRRSSTSLEQRFEQIQQRLREAREAEDMAAIRRAKRALERWQQEYGAYAPRYTPKYD